MAEISIGDLILIIISAVSGAWANGWYRDQQATKAQKQEREGLLYLIDAELHSNGLKLQNLIQNPNLLEYPSLTAPRTEDWNQAKHRLTQLLPAEHIALLVTYYEVAQAIVNAIHDTREWASAQERNETLADRARLLVRLGEQTRQMVREYLVDPPTYPIEIPQATDSGH